MFQIERGMDMSDMTVAFLDLLGFSDLLAKLPEVAWDNMRRFNAEIQQRIIDEDKIEPQNKVTSFEHLISFSDSLILGSTKLDEFVDQICDFLSSLYIESSEPFKAEFKKMYNVDSNKNVTAENGGVRKHKAYPILFRGGLSLGREVEFLDGFIGCNGKFSRMGRNVFGKTYLDAVKLESTGKGPRLFCNQSVVDNLKNKEVISIVDKESNIYEIVWTVAACDSCNTSYGRSISDPWENVQNCIYDKTLPVAINLLNHVKENYPQLTTHYEALLELVCKGIVRYADIKCEKKKKAVEVLNIKLKKSGLSEYSLEKLLEGFM